MTAVDTQAGHARLPGSFTAPGPHVVVAADLDGTLAFDNRPPGPATTEVLQTIAGRTDIRLVFATSRPPPAVHRLMGPLSATVDLLCCNGALRIDRDGTMRRTALERSMVDVMVEELRRAGQDFCLDFGEWFLASTRNALAWMGTSERRLSSATELPDGALKLSVEDAQRWLPRFSELVGDSAVLLPHEAKGDLDVTPRGVSKATGLDLLLGPHRAPVVALGNDRNDVDLLLAADEAIVVGSGLPELDDCSHTRRVAPSDAAVAESLWTALDRAFTTKRPQSSLCTSRANRRTTSSSAGTSIAW